MPDRRGENAWGRGAESAPATEKRGRRARGATHSARAGRAAGVLEAWWGRGGAGGRLQVPARDGGRGARGARKEKMTGARARAAALAAAVLLAAPAAGHGGKTAQYPYTVANDPTGSAPVSLLGESFDVYSPWQESRYADVHWPWIPDIELPPEIVATYRGKVMAITGYEVDLVREAADGSDASVPCHELYNHHYIAYVSGNGTSPDPVLAQTGHKFRRAGEGRAVAVGEDADTDGQWPAGDPDGPPVLQVFSEGNGNEHRASFHGYPRGYAQLVFSPEKLWLNPMIIDTRRSTLHDGDGSAPLPHTSTSSAKGWFSPLLECPCTDRIDIDVRKQTIDGQPWVNDCGSWPDSTLLEQRNPSCFLAEYRGGLRCCGNGAILLDKDQERPSWDRGFRWRMRWRFWHEVASPKHRNLARLYWQTESFHTELDVPPCADDANGNEECVHTITSRFNVSQLFSGEDCNMRFDPWCAFNKGTKAMDLIMAGPHCHAPNCASMELVRESTGEQLCYSEPKYGTSSAPMDERGYAIAIPPCVWGDPAEGWQAPPRLRPEEHLLSIARYRKSPNGVWHRGQMGSWQMRGAVTDDASAA